MICRGWVPERPKGADCKSVVTDYDGSNPSPSTIFFYFAGMAELADAYGSGPYGGNFMQVQVLFPAPYYDVTLIAVRREKSPRFLGDFSLYMHQLQS